MTMQQLARRTGHTIADNSPAILTALGAIGVVGTAFLSAKAAVASVDHIRDEEFAGDNLPTAQLSVKDKFGIVWRYWVLPVTAGALSVTCIVAANSISTRRNAAAIAALGISEMALREYRDKAVEIHGKNKEKEIYDAIAKDKVAENPPGDDIILAISDDKKVPVLEQMAGRWFVSDMESLRKAQNDIGDMVRISDYALLNDFYDLVGLPRTQLGDELGWNHESPIELVFSAILHEGKPAMAIQYRNNPIINPHRIW